LDTDPPPGTAGGTVPWLNTRTFGRAGRRPEHARGGC
jgi:hypothetical protein